MSEPAINDVPDTTDLLGVPGLGPVRRRLLIEAGITTRTELAQTTLEQIISVTGMPRSVAEQVVGFVAESPLSPGTPWVPFPPASGGERGASVAVGAITSPTDETSPSLPPLSPPLAGGKGTQGVPGDRGDSDNTYPSGEDTPQTTRLERAALRAQTAIADASRRAEPNSKLSRILVRFAQMTDELPRQVTPQTRGGVLRRITERIEAIAARLETVASAKKPSGLLEGKRAKRLQQRLKRTRDSIKRTLKTPASR